MNLIPHRVSAKWNDDLKTRTATEEVVPINYYVVRRVGGCSRHQGSPDEIDDFEDFYTVCVGMLICEAIVIAFEICSPTLLEREQSSKRARVNKNVRMR